MKNRKKQTSTKSITQSEYRQSGPCVFCGQHIEYRHIHLPWDIQGSRYVNSMIDRLISKCRRRMTISQAKNGFHVNGYATSTIRPVTCTACIAAIDLLIANKSQAAKPKRKMPSRAIEGKAERKRLRTMPYADFLHSEYWQAVRREKLRQADYQCEVCQADKQTLDVHHKTYIHRGCEHKHLDDLIVLCRDCHTAQHPDKTQKGSTAGTEMGGLS